MNFKNKSMCGKNEEGRPHCTTVVLCFYISPGEACSEASCASGLSTHSKSFQSKSFRQAIQTSGPQVESMSQTLLKRTMASEDGSSVCSWADLRKASSFSGQVLREDYSGFYSQGAGLLVLLSPHQSSEAE